MFDLLCFSHLRWSFVYQRPQHLMSRFARDHRVFYVEEPVDTDGTPEWSIRQMAGVTVAQPRLPRTLNEAERTAALRTLLDRLIQATGIRRFVSWYYTPAALPFTSHLTPEAVVYDCMDELSAFKGADAELPRLEQALLTRADVVFTGGHSLFEAKQHLHHDIHAMPSSVDAKHFATARLQQDDPLDQLNIPQPRFGFFGVVDERFDLELLAGLAAARPRYQFVILGPVVKIDQADLPLAPNIHYLGAKTYDELPHYLAGWNVALLLFALNDATRYISPTKTPEYLAAGRPVVSTPIADVVRTYGTRDLVYVAEGVTAFARACDRACTEPPEPRRVRADMFLRGLSWERTWKRMAARLDRVVDQRSTTPVMSTADANVGVGA